MDESPMGVIDFYYHMKKYDHCPGYSFKVKSMNSRNGGDELIDLKEEVQSIIKQLLSTPNIPVINNIQLVFEFNNIPVKLREQLVRHSAGVHWIQTSRIFDFGKHLPFFIPDEVKKSSTKIDFKNHPTLNDFLKSINHPEVDTKEGEKISLTASEAYQYKVFSDQVFYKGFREAGFSIESSNMLLPDGCRTHRCYVAFRLRDLAFVLAKRSCWIAQSDLWTPILLGIAKEFKKYSKYGFNHLADSLLAPPCKYVKDDCPNLIETSARETGKDPLPVCPIFSNEDPKSTWGDNVELVDAMVKNYSNIWIEPHKIFNRNYM